MKTCVKIESRLEILNRYLKLHLINMEKKASIIKNSTSAFLNMEFSEHELNQMHCRPTSINDKKTRQFDQLLVGIGNSSVNEEMTDIN